MDIQGHVGLRCEEPFDALAALVQEQPGAEKQKNYVGWIHLVENRVAELLCMRIKWHESSLLTSPRKSLKN